MRALARELISEKPAAPCSDEELRQRVFAELASQPWRVSLRVTPIATSGVVYLEGLVTDERERQAIRVAAENVPGLKEVRDNLEFFDPNTGWTYGM